MVRGRWILVVRVLDPETRLVGKRGSYRSFAEGRIGVMLIASVFRQWYWATTSQRVGHAKDLPVLGFL
jgi:hypothetical protein